MKKLSQGMLLLTAVILSAAASGGTVQSCSYKHEMLPVRTYPLDFSCRSRVVYSAKTETNVALCTESALKHASKVSWPTPLAMQAAQTDERTQAPINIQKQQFVTSCQFSHRVPGDPARGLLHQPAQSTERCVADQIIV